MPTNSARKRQATELARATGINYTAALRVLEYQESQQAPSAFTCPAAADPNNLLSVQGSVMFVRFSEEEAAMDVDALAALLDERYPEYRTDRLFPYRLTARMINATSGRLRSDFDIEVKPGPGAPAGIKAIHAHLAEKHPGFRVVGEGSENRYAMSRIGTSVRDIDFDWPQMDRLYITLDASEARFGEGALMARMEDRYPTLAVEDASLRQRPEVVMVRHFAVRLQNVTLATLALMPEAMNAKMARTVPGWKVVKVNRGRRQLLLAPDPGAPAGLDSFEAKVPTEVNNGSSATVWPRVEARHPGWEVAEELGEGRFRMIRKPEFPRRAAYDEAAALKHLGFAFGIDGRGGVVRLGHGEHLLVIGQPSTGKEHVAQNLIRSALAKGMIVYAADRRDQHRSFVASDQINRLAGFACTQDGAGQVIDQVFSDFQSREGGWAQPEANSVAPKPLLLVLDSRWLGAASAVQGTAFSRDGRNSTLVRVLLSEAGRYGITVVIVHDSTKKLEGLDANDIASMSRLLVGPADAAETHSVFDTSSGNLPGRSREGRFGRGLLQHRGADSDRQVHPVLAWS